MFSSVGDFNNCCDCFFGSSFGSVGSSFVSSFGCMFSSVGDFSNCSDCFFGCSFGSVGDSSNCSDSSSSFGSRVWKIVMGSWGTSTPDGLEYGKEACKKRGKSTFSGHWEKLALLLFVLSLIGVKTWC